MLQVVLMTLGVDVSIEKRHGDILASLMAVSIAGLLAGFAATCLAVLLVLVHKPRSYNKR
jgi:hypothetical protein